MTPVTSGTGRPCTTLRSPLSTPMLALHDEVNGHEVGGRATVQDLYQHRRLEHDRRSCASSSCGTRRIDRRDAKAGGRVVLGRVEGNLCGGVVAVSRV